MIKLEVKPYCHDCPRFEADVERIEISNLYFCDDAGYSTETIVKCINKRHCARLMKYLKESQEKHGL